MRIARRSLGDATCPSTEQLNGVQDCSDPCQASTAPCVQNTTPTVQPAGSPAAFAAQCLAGGGVVSSDGNSCTYPNGLGGISPSLIAVGAGVLFVFLLAMRR